MTIKHDYFTDPDPFVGDKFGMAQLAEQRRMLGESPPIYSCKMGGGGWAFTGMSVFLSPPVECKLEIRATQSLKFIL